MAEEDTKWKPLADAIAIAEDEVIRKLQSLEFRDLNNFPKWNRIDDFFHDYQNIDLEQLASRVSEKMLRALVTAVQDLVDSELQDWQRPKKYGWLAWLRSLEKERDKHLSMRAAEKDESMWAAEQDELMRATEKDEGMRILLGIS